MKKPVIGITDDYVGVSTDDLKAQCTKDRFTATVGRREIDVNRSKVSSSTDPFIGLLAGLAMIIQLQMERRL